MTADDLRNLALHVRARREARDWTQQDVWDRGGPSNSTLTAIESARQPPPSRATLRKLDASLEWVEGSAKHALGGGRPTPIEDTTQPSLFSPGQVPPPVRRPRPDRFYGGDVAVTFENLNDVVQTLSARIEALENEVDELREFVVPPRPALRSARDIGRLSRGQQRRADADQAGEPAPDNPDDMEPR